DLGQVAQVVPAWRAVDATAAPGLEIREDLGPHVLGLPGDDRVGVPQRLVGRERHPRTAQDDTLAAGAEAVRQLVGAPDLRSDRPESAHAGLPLDPLHVELETTR